MMVRITGACGAAISSCAPATSGQAADACSAVECGEKLLRLGDTLLASYLEFPAGWMLRADSRMRRGRLKAVAGLHAIIDAFQPLTPDTAEPGRGPAAAKPAAAPTKASKGRKKP